MNTKSRTDLKTKSQLPKTLTGIDGLDEITQGGFPKNRPTLICGSAGCGKTLMAVQFLVKGIIDYDEPGVFFSFEESTEDLTKNVASLGYDLKKMISDKKLKIDYIKIEKAEIEETGEYDLEGLFIRIGHAIDSIGAKRVVLDTIESLFGGLDNTTILRAEIRRLFQWLKEKKVTAVITGERGEASLTRQGLEEYLSDCVILLDFRVDDQLSTRRLRIVKYRGSTHGTNEYPFLIDENGVSVLPITSLRLDNKVSNEIVPTGIPGLNELFNLNGFYRGSTILISGPAGTAKTSMASYFVNESCKRKERVLFFAFEESPNQLIRNMTSIGLNLETHLKKGLLQIHSSRPSLQGLEMHLITLRKLILEFKPHAIVIDPLSSLTSIGSQSEVRAMLVRIIDLLKINNITGIFTTLSGKHIVDVSEDMVSSLMDTWIRLEDPMEMERKRMLNIVKSRGMGHATQIKYFSISDSGIKIL